MRKLERKTPTRRNKKKNVALDPDLHFSYAVRAVRTGGTIEGVVAEVLRREAERQGFYEPRASSS